MYGWGMGDTAASLPAIQGAAAPIGTPGSAAMIPTELFLYPGVFGELLLNQAIGYNIETKLGANAPYIMSGAIWLGVLWGASKMFGGKR